MEAAGLEDATEAPDPDEKFAAEAANRLDQTLLMLSDGICTKAVVQRARTYKRLLAKPGAHLTQWAQKYGQRIEAAVIEIGACGVGVGLPVRRTIALYEDGGLGLYPINAARNAALRLATTELVLLLDVD